MWLPTSLVCVCVLGYCENVGGWAGGWMLVFVVVVVMVMASSECPLETSEEGVFVDVRRNDSPWCVIDWGRRSHYWPALCR